MTAAKIYAQGERRMWRFWTPLVVVLVAAVMVANYQPNGIAVLLLIITGIVAFFAVVDWANVEIKAHRMLRVEAELLPAGH
ncbi:hypothetical protein [Glutamicibacter halophytocola]|uniref:Uncharacterized protein n=1 Tax=Glutamicibacter halophytocola TaxID=1933880 RepID=A0AA94XUB6_9MICC|nr:hypothetical protein [Glutamicibacter halophytocola]UUX60139.1 hypothetical protein NUH22_05885 [Glutamicibacter halophytocola]